MRLVELDLYLVDAAIYPTLFVAYLSALLKILNVPWVLEGMWLKWGIGLIVVVPFTALNIVGIKSVGRATALFTILLLIPFVLMVIMGLPHISLQHLQPLVLPGQAVPGAFAAGLFVVMWNYLGFDSISTVMGEVENPKKILPRALAISLIVATATYLLPTIVGLCVLPAGKAWDAGAWSEVARRIGGPWLQIGVAVTGLIGACGLFAATLLTASRIPMMLARDGLLPKSLGELHPPTETPLKAVLVSAFFYTVLSLETFKQLAALDVVLYSAGLCLELVALVVLRKKMPNMERPFKIPGGMVAIWMVVIVPVALIIFAIVSQFYDPDEGGKLFVISSIIGLGSGFVVYGLGKVRQQEANLPAA